MAESAAALVLPAVAGVALGLFYFGTLWLTINNLERSRFPGVVLLVTFFGRLALTMAGFYKVCGARGDRLLACLAGFVAARIFLVHRIRPGTRAGGRGGEVAGARKAGGPRRAGAGPGGDRHEPDA